MIVGGLRRKLHYAILSEADAAKRTCQIAASIVEDFARGARMRPRIA